MRALVQRVDKASVTVEGGTPREIGPGLVVLLGVRTSDTPDMCKKLAEKCAGLRVFDDEEGVMNRSAIDKGYSALVISNFTLYGDTRKGKRPSYIAAAKEPLSVDCYNEFLAQMQAQGLKEVAHGEFGAHMDVEIHNSGPVTIMLDTEEWARK